MPACLEIHHKPITGENVVTAVHCRADVDRKVKAINASLPRLLHVRKCCPRDTIFDGRTRACVRQPIRDSPEDLVMFLPNGPADVASVVVITEGPPGCEGPIVDYVVDQDDFFLRNGSYTVSEEEKENI